MNRKEYMKTYMKTYNAKPKRMAYMKAYMEVYSATPEARTKQKAYRDKPERKAYMKSRAKSYELKRFNITLEKYNEMFDNQKGCCAICGKHQSEFKKALCVEHCHTTGKVRGLTCHQCNTIIGMCYEDISILQNTINYLINAKA